MPKHIPTNMENLGFSNVGDLTPLVKDLEKVFRKHFPSRHPAFGLAFTLFPDYDEVHWSTNIARNAGIQLFREVAQKMESKLN